MIVHMILMFKIILDVHKCSYFSWFILMLAEFLNINKKIVAVIFFSET